MSHPSPLSQTLAALAFDTDLPVALILARTPGGHVHAAVYEGPSLASSACRGYWLEATAPTPAEALAALERVCSEPSHVEALAGLQLWVPEV